MSTKQEYEAKLRARYHEWSAEIERLKERAAGVEADMRSEYDSQIKELRAMQAAAEQHLSELGKASEGAWQDLKAGADAAWDAFGEAIRSARSRF